MALTPSLATPVGTRRPLPGDRIVPERMFAVTHAITIERSWPCLIRAITLLFVAGILVAGSWSEANAQTSAADQWYVNVSSGGSPQDQRFRESAMFDIYGQNGALESAYSIGGGQLFDVSAGMRVWKSLGVGIGYSANKNKNDATVSVKVPHPLVFGQSREASVTASDLEHTEKIGHLQFVWMLPLTSKLRLMFMGGPSFFTVRQNRATVRPPQDVRDEAPFTSVTITSVTVTDVKDSPVASTWASTAPTRLLESRGLELASADSCAMSAPSSISRRSPARRARKFSRAGTNGASAFACDSEWR